MTRKTSNFVLRDQAIAAAAVFENSKRIAVRKTSMVLDVGVARAEALGRDVLIETPNGSDWRIWFPDGYELDRFGGQRVFRGKRDRVRVLFQKPLEALPGIGYELQLSSRSVARTLREELFLAGLSADDRALQARLLAEARSISNTRKALLFKARLLARFDLHNLKISDEDREVFHAAVERRVDGVIGGGDAMT